MSKSIKNIFVISMLSLVLIGCGGNTSAEDIVSTDVTPPQITIIGDTSVSQVVGSAYEDLGATAVDDVDGTITAKIVVNNSVDTTKVGSYTVSYSVSDNAGNKAEAKRRVRIITAGNSDSVNPTITLNEKNTVLLTLNGTYVEKGATALDDRDGDISAKIETVGSVDTSKEGRYTIRYSVSDAAGNKAVTKRIVEVIEPLSKDSWKKSKTNATIEEQNENNITTLSLDSNDTKESIFVYKKTIEAPNKYVKWIFKTKENFSIRIIVETNDGDRTLFYNQKDTGAGKSTYNSTTNITTYYISHGIGSDAVNGEWHSSIRDIERDLKRYEPALQLVRIKEIYFYGFATQFATMKLYTTQEESNIDKPVVVSAPGVVLTFDDSYVESWNDFMPIFKQKGAVATFFCHRWTSSNDITEQEAALLKTFENDGHEVGYHTKDHLGTKNDKYNVDDTKEKKAQAYFDDQIIPGIDNMINRGFNPQSFSYPYISGQPVHNTLIKKTLPHIREFFAHVMLMDNDVQGSKTLDEIKDLLDKLKEEKEIGVLLGHWIAQALKPSNISHQVPEEKLKDVIDYAKQIGLKFYTLEEAHNIYMNQ